MKISNLLLASLRFHFIIHFLDVLFKVLQMESFVSHQSNLVIATDMLFDVTFTAWYYIKFVIGTDEHFDKHMQMKI